MNYSVVTPARDEAENLPRLAAALAGQTTLPLEWLIVDNGSGDASVAIAESLSKDLPFARSIVIGGAGPTERGMPIVRALHAGFETLSRPTGFVANVDADVSFDADFFERLLEEFRRNPTLGIVSGSGWERDGVSWRPRFVTGSTVWGATRLWRWTCLQDVLPLEPRLGWDGIDEFKANAAGWHTRTVNDVPFYHHRPEGDRDETRWRARYAQGQLCHYVGYRWWYLVLRALFNGTRSPSALGLIHGYVAEALARQPRIVDQGVRDYVRRQQSLRSLPQRAREALGR